MKKMIYGVVLSGLTLASCARRISDPYEVVEQEYLHRYGVAIPPQEWTAQGETGKVVTTLKSGVVVSKNYARGELEGETSYTYPHSELIEKIENYSQGQLVSETNYYRNGTQAIQINYFPPSARQVSTWYENGNAQSVENYQNNLLVQAEYFTVNGNRESEVNDQNGLRTRRDSFGNLIGVDIVEQGNITLTKTFHPNGSVKQTIPYVNGEIQGAIRTYLPGGEPYSIEEWNRGERSGITTYFENGERIADVPYVRGLKDGIEKRYRNGEIVVEEISWVQDQRHGPSITKIGSVTKTDYYLQGKAVSQATFDKMTNGVTASITR